MKTLITTLLICLSLAGTCVAATSYSTREGNFNITATPIYATNEAPAKKKPPQIITTEAYIDGKALKGADLLALFIKFHDVTQDAVLSQEAVGPVSLYGKISTKKTYSILETKIKSKKPFTVELKTNGGPSFEASVTFSDCYIYKKYLGDGYVNYMFKSKSFK